MAATLFFPPPSIPVSNHHHLTGDEDNTTVLNTHPHMHHSGNECDIPTGSEVPNPSPESSPHSDDDVEEEDEEDDDEEEEEGEGDETHQGEIHHANSANAIQGERPLGTLGDLGTLIGQRVTLKPRRTLSLSPTPARAGDMMARNLRAARWLDFTNEDDDDGLYQPSDSDLEGKIKKTTICTEETYFGGFGKLRLTTTRRAGSLTLGAMTAGMSKDFTPSRRVGSSMKRPLEVTLPCQEIQYLDISYQNVGIHSVQFSPIPRKKIAYHPVPYHAIHYCDVPYIGERPVKRKPPA